MKHITGFLASLKTAIYLIAVLTVLSIVGTLVPQRLESIDYIQKFPKTWQFILGMGFDDIYRCKIFLAILTLLCLSAVVCVFFRFKSTYKRLFNRLTKISEKEIQNLRLCAEIKKIPTEEALKGFEMATLENGSKIAFKSSGKSAILGGLILHIGLVLIFIGGLLGLLYGVEMSISGKAGEMIPIPPLEVIRAAAKADNMSREARQIRQFSPNNPVLEEMRKEIEALHKVYHQGLMKPEFKVAFNRLWVENYKDESGNLKGVKSWNAEVNFLPELSTGVFATASETTAVTIKVNHPVSYENYGFYLANWNKNWKKIKLKVEYIDGIEGWKSFKPKESSFPQEVEVSVGEPFEIKGFPYPLVMSSFMPDLKIGDKGFYNASFEPNNPAAMLLAFNSKDNSEIGHTWAFPEDKTAMTAHVSNLPLRFIFLDADYEYESLLQVTYDPGKPIVWIGCLLFCIGMMLTFYVNYSEKWILIRANGNACIALNSNRPNSILKKDLTIFEEELTKSEQKEL